MHGGRRSLLTHAKIPSSPVITFPVEQGFSIAVQGLYRIVRIIALLCIVQCNKESGLLHSIQRMFVLTVSQVGITGTRPRHSETYNKILLAGSGFYRLNKDLKLVVR